MWQSPFQTNSAAMPIHAGFLPEKDNLYTILADLKRTAREYTTAVTESKNPQIRQLFTQLLDSTLTLQGRLFEHMQQHQMYNASSPALRQELDKQLRQYAQTEQETAMFLEQIQQAQAQAANAGLMYNQQAQLQAQRTMMPGAAAQPSFQPSQSFAQQQQQTPTPFAQSRHMTYM